MSIPDCDLRVIKNNELTPISVADSEACAIYKAVLNSGGQYLRQLISGS
jgi:hypothetical protein